MYIYRNIKWSIIFRFAWKNLIFFILWASLVAYAYHHMEHHGYDIGIPFLPLSTIGIAVAFYIGFKNNSSYDRFWEARKIWGGIVNYSRTWGNQVLTFLGETHLKQGIGVNTVELASIQKDLIYRHIAWLYALKLQLRRPSTFSLKKSHSTKKYAMGDTEDIHWEEDVRPFLDEAEFIDINARANSATQIIRNQGKLLKKLNEESGIIEEFRFMEMMRVQEEFYNLQGMCERIKNTPFPRQYAFFSKIFVWVFIFLLPFGLVGQFADMGHSLTWMVVPFSALISWVFITMEIVGDNSEDPFENFINDVPLNALCRTIERDLKDMLDESDLPPSITPTNGILM